VRRAATAIAVILAAAGIASFGLDRAGAELRPAAADQPLDGHFDPLMPRYPGVMELPMGNRLEAGSGELRMSSFSTEDSPLRVARYYRAVWEQEGLSVHESVTPAGGVVGTYDPRVRAARSVTILTARGMTWAFPSVVERPVQAVGAGDLGRREGLPVYPGSRTGLTLRTPGGQGEDATLVSTYSNDGTLEENEAFYRRELLADGWRERDSRSFEELEGHRALELEREGQQLTVNLGPVGEEGDQVLVCVILGARR
jgi:hypothetical protein